MTAAIPYLTITVPNMSPIDLLNSCICYAIITPLQQYHHVLCTGARPTNSCNFTYFCQDVSRQEVHRMSDKTREPRCLFARRKHLNVTICHSAGNVLPLKAYHANDWRLHNIQVMTSNKHWTGSQGPSPRRTDSSK